MGLVDDVVDAAGFVVEDFYAAFAEADFVAVDVGVDVEIRSHRDTLTELDAIIANYRFTRSSLHVNTSRLASHDLIFANIDHVLRQGCAHNRSGFEMCQGGSSDVNVGVDGENSSGVGIVDGVAFELAVEDLNPGPWHSRDTRHFFMGLLVHTVQG